MDLKGPKGDRKYLEILAVTTRKKMTNNIAATNFLCFPCGPHQEETKKGKNHCICKVISQATKASKTKISYSLLDSGPRLFTTAITKIIFVNL